MEPYAISNEAIRQREHLAELIRRKAKDSDYKTAYKYIIEEVAYTWFNRLIAVRFMEVNDYLPSHIRVLSSDQGKIEPDLVTTPFDADLDFTRDEQQAIIDLKNDNKLDELFRLLFIKQCNALNEILPALFEKTNDYTELLLNLSVIDQDGVVYHLVHDIPEEDFDIERGGQVEIIGWLYQYYNTEPKNAAFAKKGKITKEEIPAVTQLFTPDWIVRYMVENSLGRLWIEHLLACGDFRTEAEIAADFGWKYYLPEAEQEPEVATQLVKIREERRNLTPEEIRCIDPCMGSGHICVYLFSVLMQIYESAGYGQRDAASSILENNLYGLDIDDRAFQIAYFAVLMKARKYNRRVLNGENKPNLYSIQESKGIDRSKLQLLGRTMEKSVWDEALQDLNELLNTFVDAKEYGSILTVKQFNWKRLNQFVDSSEEKEQISFESIGLEQTKSDLRQMIGQGRCLAEQYHVVITNPPYMGGGSMNASLTNYVKKIFPDSKSDLYAVFIERCCDMTGNYNYQAMITQHSWMFLSSFEKLRRKLQKNDVVNMAHLGSRAFDEIGGEVVQTTAFVLRNSQIKDYKGTYCRLIEPNNQQGKEEMFLAGDNRFITKQNKFSIIPGTPLVYWISNVTFSIFERAKTIEDVYDTRSGLQTNDNGRFLRVWYEVDKNKISLFGSKHFKWVPHLKGGPFRRWYGNQEYIVNWENDGKEIIDLASKMYGSYTRTVKSRDKYFKPGLTWSDVTTGLFSIRKTNEGFIFDTTAPTLFQSKENISADTFAVLNTCVGQMLIDLLAPTIHYNCGSLSKFPLIPSNNSEVTDIVDNCVIISKNDWDSFELSWDFSQHPFVRKETRIEDCYKVWSEECQERFYKLKRNEEKLNRIFIDVYGLNEELSPEIEDINISVRLAVLNRDIRSFLSYAIGCMLGRYSLDVKGLTYAGGDWDGSRYTSFIPDVDNVIPITDEEYLEDDVVARLCDWLKVVYGLDTLEENLDFIAKALGNKGNSSREIIRNYFLTDFFKDHCQTYSVTGSGKRPIYWLFDSGKQNGFKALIYLHRYNADTIGNLRIDYLHRMQRIYESEIGRMQDMIDHSTNAREAGQATKRKDKLTKQLKECREYDEKLAHLALSRIELDLDDGVKVNYRKMQTANDGKFYEVLADSKNIMAKK